MNYQLQHLPITTKVLAPDICSDKPTVSASSSGGLVVGAAVTGSGTNCRVYSLAELLDASWVRSNCKQMDGSIVIIAEHKFEPVRVQLMKRYRCSDSIEPIYLEDHDANP